jgi:hypothetical protein
MDPPAIWVHIVALDTPEHDERHLVVRIQEKGRRSISAKILVSRYSPEASILIGVAKMVERLQGLQAPLTRELLYAELGAAVGAWVDPF